VSGCCSQPPSRRHMLRRLRASIQKRPKYNSSIRLRKHMQRMVSNNLSAYGNKIYISARHVVAKLRNHNIFSRGLGGFLLFFLHLQFTESFLKPGQKFF
jgi:hypothetical protein